MTLDEQIAWLGERAADALKNAGYNEGMAGEEDEHDDGDATFAWLCRAEAASCRERAATLLTIENTLRALKRHEDALGLTAGQAFVEAVRDAAR